MIPSDSKSYPVLAAIQKCDLDQRVGDLVYQIAALLRFAIEKGDFSHLEAEYIDLRLRLIRIIGDRQTNDVVFAVRRNLRLAKWYWMEEERKKAEAVADC